MGIKKQQPMARDEALAQALTQIRDKFGDGSIMRMGEQSTQKVSVIPTGILPLDLALGIGGLPRGRIVEIFGPESTGKTTLALHAIAEAQRAGGIAAFIDVEHALDPNIATALGVNVEELYLAQPDSGEQALYVLEMLVLSGAVDIVVVDSVAALAPQKELSADYDKEPCIGLQARLMSQCLRRLTASISKSSTTVIFINQLRALINTDSYNSSNKLKDITAGGRALKFYSSVRIRVERRGNVVERIDGAEKIIGHELSIKIVKNKLAPPFRVAMASLVYGQGIPKIWAVIDAAVAMDILKQRGSWLVYKGETLGQGKPKTAVYLAEHSALTAEIVQEVMRRAS